MTIPWLPLKFDTIVKEAGNPSLILTSGYFGMRICHGQVRNFFETTSHSQDPRLFTMLTFFIVPNHAKELIIKNAETMPFRLYLGKLSIFVYLGKTLHGKSLCHGFF